MNDSSNDQYILLLFYKKKRYMSIFEISKFLWKSWISLNRIQAKTLKLVLLELAPRQGRNYWGTNEGHDPLF